MKILKNLKAAAEAILKRFPSKHLLFMVGNRNIRIKREICFKLAIKTPQQRRPHSRVFIVNFKAISCLLVVFLLMSLNK